MRKLFVLVVLILASTAAYLWFAPQDNSRALQTDQELLPDYVALNVTRRLYNADGYLADSVSAKRLEHFDQLGFTQFEMPVYTLYNELHQAGWQASSQSAVWFANDKVILEQQVNIISLMADGMIERIETDNLEMLFYDQLLRNDRPVRISGKGFTIQGVGLEADLTTKSFKLLQHQQTVYRNED